MANILLKVSAEAYCRTSAAVEPTVVTRRKRLAFTLVELLVVIGIIALLISILLPALNRVRAQMLTVSCASNLRQVMMGLNMYAQDNQGSLPYCYGQERNGRPYFWASKLVAGGTRYLGEPKILVCPDRLGLLAPVWANYVGRTMDDPETYYADSWGNAYGYISYAANRFGAMPVYYDADGGGRVYKPIKLGATGIDPTQFLILTESMEVPNTHQLYGTSWTSPMYMNYYGYNMQQYLHVNDVTNTAFLDGHVASLKAVELRWDSNTNYWATNASDYNWQKGPPWYLITVLRN